MMGGRGGDMVLGKKGCEADLCEGASAAGGLCEGGLHTGRFLAVLLCFLLLSACGPVSDVPASRAATGHTGDGTGGRAGGTANMPSAQTEALAISGYVTFADQDGKMQAICRDASAANLTICSGTDYAKLSLLTGLRELKLDFSSFSPDNLKPLKTLTKLEVLDISHEDLVDISALSGLGTHTSLTLSGTNLAWDGWEPVGHVLDVSGRPPVENAGAVLCPQNWVKRIQDAYPDGCILFLDYDDYDGDGVYEAFAFVADGKETASRIFEGYAGALVFVTEKSMEEVKREARGQYVSGYYRFEDMKVIILTDLDTFTSSTSYLWTVKDGSPRSMNLSGWGMGFHLDDMGNVCLRTSAYDGSVSYLEMENGLRDLIGSGHSYKPYYFFFENGDFAEYGAIQVTMDEFLACQGAEEVLGNAETDGFKAAGILYRGNGLIHLNLRRDHEDERGYDSRYQTFRMCPGAMTLIDSDMGTYRESLTDYGQEEKTVPVVYPSGLPIHDAN